MTDPAIQLGRTIRTLREAQKLSQSELAKKMGVTRQSVSRWESGDGTLGMSLMTFHKLMKALDSNPVELLEGK